MGRRPHGRMARLPAAGAGGGTPTLHRALGRGRRASHGREPRVPHARRRRRRAGLEHDPDIWLPGPPPSARPVRRTSASPAAAELDALTIGNSSLLPVVFKGLYNPARFQRPGNGVPPFYNEGERRVYVHTGDGFGMLSAEQEAPAGETCTLPSARSTPQGECVGAEGCPACGSVGRRRGVAAREVGLQSAAPSAYRIPAHPPPVSDCRRIAARVRACPCWAVSEDGRHALHW